MSLFNVHIRGTLKRNVDDGSVTAIWDDRFGSGGLPKDLQSFLVPEHKTWDKEWLLLEKEWTTRKKAGTVESGGGERFWFMLTKDTGAKEFGFCLRSFVQRLEGTKERVFCECDVVLSDHCWPAVFFTLLDIQRKIAPKKKHLFLQRISGSPLPAPGQGYRLNLPADIASEPMILRVPKTRFFYGDVLCGPLLTSLSVKQVVHVILAAMMHERRLVFVSSSLQILSFSLHAALSLMYPFRFEVCVIPLIPSNLVEMCMATFPFVLGCHASLIPLIRALPLEEVVFVDLDLGTANVDPSDVAALPRSATNALADSVNRIVQAHGVESAYANLAIQDSFVDFFVEIFGSFRQHIRADGKDIDKEAMLKGAPKSCRVYLQQIMETQTWSSFVHRRLGEPNNMDDFEKKAQARASTHQGGGGGGGGFFERMVDKFAAMVDDAGAPVVAVAPSPRRQQVQRKEEEETSPAPRRQQLQRKEEEEEETSPPAPRPLPQKDLLDLSGSVPIVEAAPALLLDFDAVVLPHAPAAVTTAPSSTSLLDFDAVVMSPSSSGPSLMEVQPVATVADPLLEFPPPSLKPQSSLTDLLLFSPPPAKGLGLGPPPPIPARPATTTAVATTMTTPNTSLLLFE